MTTKKNKRKEKFLETFKKSKVNEKTGLISKKIESDTLASEFDKYSKTYRPSVRIEKPEDFCFFGSAQQYYLRSYDYISNYYPFDGTREGVVKWHKDASTVDLAMFRQAWPSTVGHLKLNYSEKVFFYAGPNKIPESEFTARNIKTEPGILINPKIGSTIEFWLKKDSFDKINYPQETIAHVGTYPGKEASSKSGEIKIFLSSDSDSPFYINYKSGDSSVNNIQIGSSTVTDSTVADSKWHHYAFKFWKSDSLLYIKLFIDGKPDSTKSVSFADTIEIKSFLAGSIGGNMQSSSGNLSASIDEFRFWKGQRSTREIARFFDKKIYASHATENEYTNRLGVYYRFNKVKVGDANSDSLIIDHSGHEIFGKIQNYNENSKIQQSAITLSETSENSESPDPILDRRADAVMTLEQRFNSIAKSYDENNQSMLQRFIPEWAREEIQNSSADNPSEFQILLHLLSSEFDEIKVFLDSISTDYVPNWQETNQIIAPVPEATGSVSINYADNIYIGCKDDGLPSYRGNGYRGDRYQRQMKSAGLMYEKLFQKSYKLEDDVEGTQDFISADLLIEEARHAFEQRLAAEAPSLMKAKGTQSSLDRLYETLGYNNTDITDMHLIPEEDLLLEDSKVEAHTSTVNSVSFVDNNEGTLFMAASADDERTHMESDSSHDSREYTFEGTYIIPSQEVYSFENKEASLFGCREVEDIKNNLTQTSPDDANFTAVVEKQNLESKRARFVLKSSALLSSDIQTQYFNNVYDNSRWNISVRVRKSSSEPFIETASESYELTFQGYNYVQDSLVQTFHKVSPISKSEYDDFKDSCKTVFLGAARENITGSVLIKSDVKMLNFSAWQTALSDGELKLRAQNPLISGGSLTHMLER